VSSVRASAPTRIDLAGGTLDIWPLSVLVSGAVTVNLAVELRAHASVERRRDGRVVVISADRKARAVRRLPLRPSDCTGPLSLLLRLCAAFAPDSGLTLRTRAEAPAGAGLGGSSALAMAVGAALARFTGTPLRGQALLRRVMNLEAVELGVPTGNQDYLAALHGGLSAWHHEADGTRRERLPLPAALGRRLVLAYTGQPRHSGFSNWDMFRRSIEKEATTLARMGEIARIARAMRDALLASDLDGTGRLLGEEGRLRYRLAPSVATPLLLAADRAARRAGALGVKVCGAGGGGCLVAFAAEGRAEAVARALDAAGARVLTAPPSGQGLRVDASGPGGGWSGRRARARSSRSPRRSSSR
jgi:D-glycero-alpha-D-manno-heptose-7-phosphate kinase